MDARAGGGRVRGGRLRGRRDVGDAELHAHEFDAGLCLEQARQSVHLADGEPPAVEASLRE